MTDNFWRAVTTPTAAEIDALVEQDVTASTHPSFIEPATTAARKQAAIVLALAAPRIVATAYRAAAEIVDDAGEDTLAKMANRLRGLAADADAKARTP